MKSNCSLCYYSTEFFSNKSTPFFTVVNIVYNNIKSAFFLQQTVASANTVLRDAVVKCIMQFLNLLHLQRMQWMMHTIVRWQYLSIIRPSRYIPAFIFQLGANVRTMIRKDILEFNYTLVCGICNQIINHSSLITLNRQDIIDERLVYCIQYY